MYPIKQQSGSPEIRTTDNMRYWAQKWFANFDSKQEAWWIKILLFMFWQKVSSRLFLRDLHALSESILEGRVEKPGSEEPSFKKVYYTSAFLSQNPEALESIAKDVIAAAWTFQAIEATLQWTSKINTTINQAQMENEKFFAQVPVATRPLTEEAKQAIKEVEGMRSTVRAVAAASKSKSPAASQKTEESSDGKFKASIKLKIATVFALARNFGIIDKTTKPGDFKSVRARKTKK